MAMNSTAACVLGILDLGPPPPAHADWKRDPTMSGAQVWSALEQSVAGFWSLTRSQVYQELQRLTADGLVSVSDAGRYALTDAGRVAARQWFVDRARDEPREDQIRSPITLTVFFGHYLPGDVLERVVREHELRAQRRLESLRAMQAALGDDHSLPGSTLQRATLHVSGAIEWAHDVLDRLQRRPRPRARKRRAATR